jgi:hypothetical protein
MVTEWGWFAVTLVTILLIGFSWGRRLGFRQGKQRGADETVWVIWEQSLRQGVCLLCKEKLQQKRAGLHQQDPR